jgi:uncharacterized protein Smg (DUF494 family)
MTDRLTDILARLRERFAADAAPAEVEEYLSSEGYDRRQIGEILGRLFPDLARAPAVRPALGERERSGAFRVLGPHERARFAPEAWGHLLSLTTAGVLDAAELEHVIERALVHIDGRIALDDLRSLLEHSGLDDRDASGGPLTVH